MPPPRDLSALLARLGIEARRRGRELHARCPSGSHEDRRPSWRMRDDPQDRRHSLQHCMGCGFGGNLNDLVMHVRRCSWSEAEEWIDGHAAADQRPVPAAIDVRAPSLGGFTLPIGVEVVPLAGWPQSARTYAEQRGLTPEQIERWGVAYAVEGRLAGRLVMPKRDATGRIGGYTARSFVGSPRKYLEPQAWERPLPILFGEQHWRDRDRLFVVEGALNALAIERAIPSAQVAATVGSELSAIAAVKFASWRQLIVVTDPDKAGDRLAKDVADRVARHGVRVLRVRLAEGEDAASVDRGTLATALDC